MSSVVIVVQGGLVQNVYVKGDPVRIEVLDFDYSDYPNDEEIKEKGDNEDRLKHITVSNEYRMVY